MKTTRTFVLVLVAAAIALCAACNTSKTSADPTRPATTAPMTTTPLPSESTVDAWRLRLDAVGSLMGQQDDLYTPQGWVSLVRTSTGEIISAYISNVADDDYVDAFFTNGVVERVLYTVDDQPFDTNLCKLTTPGKNCATSGADREQRFLDTMKSFDKNAAEIFGSDYPYQV